MEEFIMTNSIMPTEQQKQEMINYVKSLFNAGKNSGRSYEYYTLFDDIDGLITKVKIIPLSSNEYIQKYPTVGDWFKIAPMNDREIGQYYGTSIIGWLNNMIVENKLRKEFVKAWLLNNNINLNDAQGQRFFNDNRHEIYNYIREFMEEVKNINTNTF